MTNDEVLKRGDKRRILFGTIAERRTSMVGHLLLHSNCSPPVSYTHLDVYKRQAKHSTRNKLYNPLAIPTLTGASEIMTKKECGKVKSAGMQFLQNIFKYFK